MDSASQPFPGSRVVWVDDDDQHLVARCLKGDRDAFAELVVRYQRVGTPAFYLAWLRPAVFASALWTEPGNSSLRRRYGNVGAQVDLRFSILHRYEMTLSFGYAVGYRGGERAGNEWMISLQIM